MIMTFDRSLEVTFDTVFNLLNRLIDGGFFNNNRQLFVSNWFSSSRLTFKLVCSMKNLETLNSLDLNCATLEDLQCLFRSCPKLTNLHYTLPARQELNEDLKNELRSGFQRLGHLSIDCRMDNNSFLVIREMLK